MKIILDVIKKNDLLLILLLLLVGNFLVRWGFELHFHKLPFYFDQEQIKYIHAKWYTFLTPANAKLWGGEWSIGMGLFPLFRKLIGNTNTYLVLNLLFISVAYVLSWFSFRSKVLTITVGICTAFTTFNNHVYQCSALIVFYIPLILCLLNLFLLFKLFQYQGKSYFLWFVWLFSLLLYILSFEGWLEYFAILLILFPFGAVFLLRLSDYIRLKRLVNIIIITTVLAMIYIMLKIKYGYEAAFGSEHDILLNYGLHYWPLATEDFISNLFTFFYSTVITYIPPIFSFSNSLFLYGPKTLIQLQGGYDHLNSAWVVINAIMLWRFYAGVLLAAFLYYLYKILKRTYFSLEKEYFLLLVFMLMILFGSPAHLFIKFRPFHSIPWLPYLAFIGQIGLMLFISYLLKMLHESSVSKQIVWIITIIIWLDIVLCLFLKQSFYHFGAYYFYQGHSII